MADEPVTPSGWLPPVAPGGGRPPGGARPAGPAGPGGPAAPAHPPRPTFVAAPGPRNPRAVWAIVLAVSGLGLLVVSLGTLFAVTLPLSVAGWVLAARARSAARSTGDTAGQSQITAALWLARAGVLAGIVAAAVLIALIASEFDFEQLRDDLERELERREREDRQGGGGVRAAVEGLRATVGR